MLHAFANWVGTTSLSWFVMHYAWVWPTAETLHFVGLSLVVGVSGLFDLRLMGFFRDVPVAALQRMVPWAIAGFAINLSTGVLFFFGTPFQYVDNLAFRLKMAFVVLDGVNALLFELLVSERTLAVGAGGETPITARIIGAASLVCWLSVLCWGRLLPYIGEAF